MTSDTLLTFPDTTAMALSIRAKALLFHDPRSIALLHHVERVAASDATVLVIGETGTGKELVARHIHKQSSRRGPFVAVNCGAFSETLIDAELFGHESGAFTGASQARAGWFEAANGGTLFLDEIGDLSLPLQVKLLRVLQERQVVRLGSRRPIPLDVRLVAATNVDLQAAVLAQRFRADLFYRLSVAAVHLPPLRERPGDILPLAQHFVGQYGPKLGLHDAYVSEEARAALLSYAWPGNIRELENAVHLALIVCRDGAIQASDLKLAAPLARAPVIDPAGSAALPATLDTEDKSFSDVSLPGDLGVARERLRGALIKLLAAGDPDLFRTVEFSLLRTAFSHCRDNQVHTARTLGISRNTLRTLLKRHGLLGGDDEPAHVAPEPLRIHPEGTAPRVAA